MELLAGAMAAALAAGACAGDVHYRFDIARSKGTIYNPWTLRDDKVELRSFLGSGAKPGDFVAPVIRVAPGQRLDILLDNKLEPCSEEQHAKHLCFNDTNLHTHGLWVSPSGNSDNVLVSVAPGTRFQYSYDIPADHPAGTFWYHPHRHGVGFVQVGSGMAGALIVTGNRLPTMTTPGDIDILLKDDRGTPFPERVMIFQQIQYGCLDDKGVIEGKRDEKKDYIRPFTCSSGRMGTIESPEHDWDWPNSGRFTGINGDVQPVLAKARSGQFERWRLIHGGTREPVKMRIYRLAEAAPDLRSVKGEAQEEWISRYCNGPALPMWITAMDGLTRSQVRRTDVATLFAGERVDLIVRFPSAGRYCLIQDASRLAKAPQPLRALTVIEARGGQAPGDGATELQAALITAANRALSGVVRDRVVGQLRDGLKLGAFSWHKPIPEDEVIGYREMTLNIIDTPKLSFFHVNGRPYDHHRIDHVLPLGKAEEWRLASLLGHHPLHMHVNPFQIVSISDHLDRDVTDPKGEAFDPDYAGLKGEWKDTIFVKQDHRVAFRTRYERFTGDFVTHCHIMFHGDHGMMQNLRIAAEGEQEMKHDGH